MRVLLLLDVFGAGPGCGCGGSDSSAGLCKALLEIRGAELSAQILDSKILKICYSYFFVLVEVHDLMH